MKPPAPRSSPTTKHSAASVWTGCLVFLIASYAAFALYYRAGFWIRPDDREDAAAILNGLDNLTNRDHEGRGADSPRRQLVEKYYPPGQARAVCRIHNACVRFEEARVTVGLPPWLRNRPGYLKGCGDVDFDTEMGSSSSSNVTLNDDLLLGMTVSRRDYHFPHWLVKAGALMDIIDILFGAEKPRYMVECEHCSKAKLHSNPLERLRETFSPAMVTYADVKDAAGMSRWTNSFISYLFRFHTRDPNLYAFSSNSSSTFEGCFRSIIIPPTALNKPAERSIAHHVLFSKNGLRKYTRPDICNATSPIIATILDRDDSRSFGNIPAVHGAVQRAFVSRGREVWVRRIAFDNATFSRQVEVMQSSDVVVSAHGAAVANAVFLRKKSLLLDVYPFGYYYGALQAAAKSWFELECSWLVSRPDRASFQESLKQVDPRRFPETRYTKRDVMKAYNRLLNKFDVLPNDFFDYWDKDVEFLNHVQLGRQPLKHQRLYPDSADLSKRILRWYNSLCGTYEKPTGLM